MTTHVDYLAGSPDSSTSRARSRACSSRTPAARPAPAGHGRAARRLTPAEGGWTPIWAPSALAFDDGYAVPRELTQAEIDGVIGAFARAARTRPGRRVSCHRTPRRPWLPDPRVFVAALEPARRRLRRFVRGTLPVAARDRRRSPRRLARALSAVRAHLGDRLGRGRLDGRRLRRARAAAGTGRRRPDRLFFRRERAARPKSRSARAIRRRSPSVCGAKPAS